MNRCAFRLTVPTTRLRFRGHTGQPDGLSQRSSLSTLWTAESATGFLILFLALALPIFEVILCFFRS